MERTLQLLCQREGEEGSVLLRDNIGHPDFEKPTQPVAGTLVFQAPLCVTGREPVLVPVDGL